MQPFGRTFKERLHKIPTLKDIILVDIRDRYIVCSRGPEFTLPTPVSFLDFSALCIDEDSETTRQTRDSFRNMLKPMTEDEKQVWPDWKVPCFSF